MENVFTFDPKARADEDRKKELLEVLDHIRKEVQEGRVKELVACSMDENGSAQIHVSALDIAGGVGLFEIGKHLLIQAEAD
jgi:hypothetical protein